MSDQKNKFYLTTPIYYVNARPHIGHAYTTLVADVLARRHRLLGPEEYKDTLFLTGTDEHGQKIERSAAAAGVPPQQFADQVSKSFEDLWKRMGITNDRYIRTTDPAHKRGAQKLFADLYARGQIYLSSYTGQYSIGEEMFVEGPPGTIGPDGKPTETVTEENFFFRLSDYQLPLLNLIESDTLRITPEARKNEVLSFLRGNTLEASLLDVVILSEARSAESKDPGAPGTPTASGTFSTLNIQHTALGNPYIPGALRDLSVSRSSFTWGIPVPDAILAAARTTQKHVIYVWLDALANYMTAVGYGSDDPKDIADFARYWPADLHLVGKEITRFHCVYWPAFLLGLNPKLQHRAGERTPELGFEEHRAWATQWLPKQITAHGWLLFDNSKMSKSRGNIVRTETILDAFGTLCPPTLTAPPPDPVILSEGAGPHPAPQSKDPESTTVATTAQPLSTTNSAAPTQHDRDLFAADVLRYYLLREIPFGQDGSFSFDALITRYNADLANGYGNLVSRTLTMITQNCDAKIPSVSLDVLTGIDRDSAERRVSRRELTQDAPIDESYVKATILPGKNSIEAAFTIYDFFSVAESLAIAVSTVDAYLSFNKPWLLAKSTKPQDRKKLDEVLYTAAESIRIITALLYPILPYATARVWAQLGLGDIELAAREGKLTNLQWGGLKPGTKLGPLAPIFPRADKGLAQIMTDMENQGTTPPGTNNQQPTTHSTDPGAAPRTSSLPSFAGSSDPLPVGGSTALTTGPQPVLSHTDVPASGIFANQPAVQSTTTSTTSEPPSATTQITIDDFAKVELRVAQILVAERIPKADKLLRLEVDLGYEKRQILSGIAEFYAPEDLIGRRIVVITNLAPRKMRGLESHGMLLAASVDHDGQPGKPILATMAEDIALGARLK